MKVCVRWQIVRELEKAFTFRFFKGTVQTYLNSAAAMETFPWFPVAQFGQELPDLIQ